MGPPGLAPPVTDGPSLIQQARALHAAGRPYDAEEALRRAASSGHVEAMAELATQILMRAPPLPAAIVTEAAGLARAAADSSHAGAMHLAALLAANDPSVPNHWQTALGYLARAAELGHGLAQFQLAFLAEDAETVQRLATRQMLPSITWQRLRDAIDIAALTGARPPTVISHSPYIAVAEAMVSPQMCDWIVNRARPMMKPAQIYNPLHGGAHVLQRTNSEMFFAFPLLDLVTLVLRQRLVGVTGLSHAGMEMPSVYHYAPGQEFSPHFDFLDPRLHADEIARTGQRVATGLVYLNDGFDGGHTDFAAIGIRFKGRKGDALIFHNVDAAGVPDIRTSHAGRAPIRGEKWLFSQFMRAQKI